MKILPFSAPPVAARNVASRIALVESLLKDCGRRQAALREEGRTLRLLLERLQALHLVLILRTSLLHRSAGRLGACSRRVGPSPPTA